MKYSLRPKNMNQSIKLYLVILMLSIISSFFSSAILAAKLDKFYLRQVDLSGNIFQFSMPEDFSKDMPAEDMVESLDISKLEKFDDPKYGNIIRRWWDIKEPGWFGKKLGTIMMDISVQKVPENMAKKIHSNAYDVTNRMDFMLMLDEVFHRQYDELNRILPVEPGRTSAYHSGFASMSGRNIYALHNENVAHNQKWVKQSVAGPTGTIIVNYATPINTNVYILVSLTFSPNNGISTRELLGGADNRIKGIDQSFKIIYTDGNSVAKKVGGEWMLQSNDEVLNQHRESILRLFYGNDFEKVLLQQEKENAEAMNREKTEMREALKPDPLSANN